MKYLILCFLFVISTLFAEAAVKEKDPLQELDTKARTILDLISNDKLAEAISAADELKKTSTLPIHDCLKAAALYKILEEYRTREFEKEFNDTVERAVVALEDESKDTEKGDKYKAKRLQFLGSAYGYRGMYRTLSGLWASAFLDGKRGSDTLETSLALDPTLIDNKAGIGTYLYWRSAKAGVVKYLLFWGDKKQEGIDGLKAAVTGGRIVKQWALGGLLRIYVEEKNWPLALEYANRALKDNSSDTGTLRKKAMVLFMLGKKEDSLKVLKDELLPIFRMKDNTVLFGDKKINTANAQIETIYRILKINNELNKKVVDMETVKQYLSDIDALKQKETSSFLDIAEFVEKAKKI